MNNVEQVTIWSKENYENILNKVESEIAELRDDQSHNDKFELDWFLTQGFAEFVGKERATQWLKSIKDFYNDDEKEKPEWLQSLIDFLESVIGSSNNEDDGKACRVTYEDVDMNRKYGFALDGSEYNENNSFTSRSGITYKLYDQTKWWWSIVSKKGCMVTSAAVVSSSLWNFWITPWEVFGSRCRTKYPSDSVPILSENKLKSTKLSIWKNTSNEIISSLQNGNPAIIMAYGRNKWGQSRFTRNQHYMALLDISQDWSKIFVGNSYTGLWGSHSSNGWYPTSEVLTSVREATTFFRA